MEKEERVALEKLVLEKLSKLHPAQKSVLKMAKETLSIEAGNFDDDVDLVVDVWWDSFQISEREMKTSKVITFVCNEIKKDVGIEIEKEKIPDENVVKLRNKIVDIKLEKISSGDADFDQDELLILIGCLNKRLVEDSPTTGKYKVSGNDMILNSLKKNKDESLRIQIKKSTGVDLNEIKEVS